MKKLLFFLSLILIISSCQKEDVIKNKEIVDVTLGVRCVNGELYFDTSESFEKTIDYIAECNDNELDLWEKKMGFISYRKLKNDLISQLEKITDEAEYYSTIASNNDIVSLVDDKLVFFIDDKIYSSIVGINRIYHFQNIMNEVVNNELFSSSKIDLHNQSYSELTINSNIKKLTIIYNDILKSTNCGTYQKASLSSNDRMVYIDAGLVMYTTSGAYYTGDDNLPLFARNFLRLKVSVWGYKKNIFKKWVNYNTLLKFQLGNFKICIPTSFDNYYWIINDWTETSQNDCSTFTQYKRINSFSPGQFFSSNYSGFYFESIYIEGSSRGFNFVDYAKINCGN
jgi:hypothetical protein